MTESPHDLVRNQRWVRIFDDARQGHVMAEGEVIGYSDVPVLYLRHADGTQSSWNVTLPREVIDRPLTTGGAVQDGDVVPTTKETETARWEGGFDPMFGYWLWPCPQGCGRQTEDPNGGPCEDCWVDIDDWDEEDEQ